MRAYLLKEDFRQLWTYQSATWAGKFPDAWCISALRPRIKPIKKIARMYRRHRELIFYLVQGQRGHIQQRHGEA